ncbi:MAG TPA: hypothetical protein VKG23_11615 [Thermoanaerobaculia bacterium]|nr:hypothetical protein [Thermoanaerobaculia bacterium]
MADHGFTRRTAVKGAAALGGALALGGWTGGSRETMDEKPTLVLFWLNGGPAGLFNSAGSFLRSGAFGVGPGRVLDLGNDLFVDAGSLGALPSFARSHMASINFRHGVVRPHEAARAAVLQAGSRSQLLRLAAAMPVPARRCAVLNDLGFPVGISADPPAEGGLRLERVVDAADLANGLDAGQVQAIRSAYGATGESTAICDQAATFAAAEMLVHAGAGVVFAQPAYTGRPDRQFDTHEDADGTAARAVMAPITPSLAMFLGRTLELPGRNVVVLLVGEFSRTVPASDHEPGGTATVIGKSVRPGTAGPQQADGSPPPDAPPPESLWAFVAAALRVDGSPFGKNPNRRLVA